MLVFIVLRELPGDPLFLYIADNRYSSLTPEDIHDLRVQFGLDRSLPVQYVDWLNRLVHGDFGTSVLYRNSVADLIKGALPITVSLSLLAMLVSAIIGIVLGALSALRRGKWPDTVATMLANIGITAPGFWVAIILMFIFGLKLRWLPPFGYTSPFTDFGMFTRQAIMPIICLAIFPIGALTRQTRSGMLEVMRQDYIRTAWSKGLKEQVIVIRHMLKNALIPIITLLGMQLRQVFSGAVIIETVFNIPGMGRLSVDALFSRDFIIVQDVVLIISAIVILSNLFVDVAYGIIDPRIRYG